MKNLAAFLILIFISQFSFSQDYEVRHYTVEDGLMSNNVTGIYEDSLGVIWVANGFGFSKLFGEKIENIIGFENEGDAMYEQAIYGTKMISRGFITGEYQIKNNSIEKIKVPLAAYHSIYNNDTTKNLYPALKDKNGFYYKKTYQNNEFTILKFKNQDTINLGNIYGASFPKDWYYYNFELTEEGNIILHDSISIAYIDQGIDSCFIHKNIFNRNEPIRIKKHNSSYFFFKTSEESTIYKLVKDSLLKLNYLNFKPDPYNYRLSFKRKKSELWFKANGVGLFKIYKDSIYQVIDEPISDFVFNSNEELIFLNEDQSELRNQYNETLIHFERTYGSDLFISTNDFIYNYSEAGLFQFKMTNSNFKVKKSDYNFYLNIPDQYILKNNYPMFISTGGRYMLNTENNTIHEINNIEKLLGIKKTILGPYSAMLKVENEFYFTYLVTFEDGTYGYSLIHIDSNFSAKELIPNYLDSTKESIMLITSHKKKLYLFTNKNIIKLDYTSHKIEDIISFDGKELIPRRMNELSYTTEPKLEFELFDHYKVEGNYYPPNSIIETFIFDYEKLELKKVNSVPFVKENDLPLKYKNGWFIFKNDTLIISTKNKTDTITSSNDYQKKNCTITNYLVDANDNLFIISSYGFHSFNAITKELKRFSGFDKNLISPIKVIDLSEDSKYLWAFDGSGIIEFDIEKLLNNSPVNSKRYKLPITDGWFINSFKDSILLVFNEKGYSEIRVGENRYIPPAPKIHFSSLRQNYATYDWSHSTTDIDSSYGNIMPYNMSLRHEENHLTFDYQGVSHSNKEPLIYFHKLVGLDTNFVETLSKSATYSNLEAGDYTFQVFAQDENQSKSEIIECSFSIAPPYWETWWFISLCILAIGSTAYSGYQYNIKRLKARQEELEQEVETATAEIRKQKDEIEESHREITDSINYAERIQRSFLATEKSLKENLNEYFVYFNPKEAVSGDFYWAGKLHNGNFALVNADSTGHGVPGAIMSILNITSIEKAVDQNLIKPADIFNQTRTTIIDRLKNDGSQEGGKDGMDASLIAFNTNKTKMYYVAAQNPIWIIRDGNLKEIKPEKMPVGRHHNENVDFVGGEYDLQKGDVIYTLTDGFQDQFGGVKGKKFMIKKLREYVLSISHLPMNEQYQKISDTFSNWKGELEQIDDVCVIGLRV